MTTNRVAAIFGLGYVGCVSAGCLAQLGWHVVGVDVNPDKVALMAQGKPTVIEKDIDAIIHDQWVAGRITATTDPTEAVRQAQVSFICVATPSDRSGNVGLSQVFRVASQIGDALQGYSDFHVVALRSTVPPGTCHKVEEIIADRSGLTVNETFAVVSNPEFIREGTSVEDYFNPPYTVIGSPSQRAAATLRAIYAPIVAPLFEVEREVAEMIKYVNNSYHALKVTFANEVGNVCKALGIDAYKVMDLFTQDTRLNISPAYFRPGFAFGGSCLPKDLRALNSLAHGLFVEVPVLAAVERSNELQLDRAIEMVRATGKKQIGVLGLAFKSGTDDLRESPSVELAERLLGKGYLLKIYDPLVNYSRLIGANKSFIEAQLPHVNQLLVSSLDEIRSFAEVVVITQKNPEYLSFVNDEMSRTIIIDLVRLWSEIPRSTKNYMGICW